MQLPLIFTFDQVVYGDGFIAEVRMRGRALLEEEVVGDGETEHWISGVAPAGFAGGGADRNAAFNDFRVAWGEVLFDIAADCTSFDQFQAECRKFYDSKREHLTRDWIEARERVRREQVTDEQLRTADPAEAEPDFCIFNVAEAASPNGDDKGSRPPKNSVEDRTPRIAA